MTAGTAAADAASPAPATAPRVAAPAVVARVPTDALQATAAALQQINAVPSPLATASDRTAPGGPGRATGAGPMPGADIDALLQRLEQRLQRNPDDADGWLMLARSNASLDRHAAAVKAYAQAARLRPRDASLLADWADAQAMAQGGDARGEPARLIAQALEIDPRHPKALVMAGVMARGAGDLATARQRFEQAAAVAPHGSELALAMRQQLALLDAGAGAAR